MSESQEATGPTIVQVPSEQLSGGPLWCSPWCWLNVHHICAGKAHACSCLCHDPKVTVVRTS